MISFQEKPYEVQDIIASLHPLVREWFFSKFTHFSPPQQYSIVNIHRRLNTLISSPTGSGKTLSAFLTIINELVVLSLTGSLEDRVYAIYISPLKALGNDIKKNLEEPLAEIQALAEKKKYVLDIRVASRTGDSTSYEKTRMLKIPPHILITTPESFGIMLTTLKFREKIIDAEWVIIDEIHALAENKRGSHLSLSLERFERVRPGFCRIALSATVNPLEEVAKFLVGHSGSEWRDCLIVTTNTLKDLDVQVISPVENLIREEYDTITKKTYEIIDSLVQRHKTTLIFTNTRNATERVVHHLKESYPSHYAVVDDEEQEAKSLIAAHHGSLSKEHRLDVEKKLKSGQLKVVVSSTSLELGIDIGSIDLVILLGSPKSVARALQRIGRSGHQLHQQAKGRIIVQDRDDLVECSLLLKAAIEGKIDTLRIPKNPLDVLAQHVLGAALEEQITRNDLLRLFRQSYSFRTLSDKDFDDIISYLSGEYVSLQDRHVYAKIWKDESTGMMGKKGKLARLIYMTNIGTIPDETNVLVKVGLEVIGSVSEPFLEKLKKGDIFVLGGQTYEFRHAQGLTAHVRIAIGRRPTVPSWYSEMLPLSFDLAEEINTFRKYMDNYFSAKKSKNDILKFIDEYLYVDAWSKNSLYEYFAEQFRYLEIPHSEKLLIEHYQDGQFKYILFHSLYGRRVNDALSRVVAYVISRIQQRDVEIIINDNGFAIRTTGNVQAARALRMLRSEEIVTLAKRSLDKTEILSRRFRHCAARSLMILRNYKGKSKSVGKQQMSSRLLLSSVQYIDADFVILRETKREVLEDVMDIFHTQEIIKRIESKKIMLKEVQSSVPSPFAFNLILTGYTDIMKMQDRQAFLRKMHELVLAKISLQKEAPKDILHQAKTNPSFNYQEFWGMQQEHKLLSDEETTDILLAQLLRISRRIDLPASISFDLQELIKRRNEPSLPSTKTYHYRRETIAFIEELIKGPVPKMWSDQLIQLFMKHYPEMTWKER